MEERQERRVKVTGAATHRTGERRAAVKPHKRESATNVRQVIEDYLGGLKKGTLTQTYTAATLAKNAGTIRAGFGLGSTDELYLLTDPTGTGKAGMLLCSAGVCLADGRGGKVTVKWAELPGCAVGCQRGMLVIGQSGVVTADAKTLADLLKTVQKKLAQ